jgi:hypothetical protein
MIKNFLILIKLLIFFLFLFFVVNYYISKTNKLNIAKNRLKLNTEIILKNTDLEILKNDTNDIIVFNNDFSSNISIKDKRKFWDLFKK